MKIINKMVNSENIKFVLNELIEYSYDLDPQFSSAAVKMIGNLSLKFQDHIDIILLALQ